MMPLQKQKKIIVRLHVAGILSVDDYTPFPKPYCVDPSAVKAIYLGCDPSNTGGKRFCYAFALPDGEEYGFGPFVKDHKSNLLQIGLSWETVYAQNLCQNYFTKETSANLAEWKKAAEIWTKTLKKELSAFPSDIPVLLTAEVLYEALLKSGVKPQKAIEFYNCKGGGTIPVPPKDNKLDRPLIPFYRHRRYHLLKNKWPSYQESVSKWVK